MNDLNTADAKMDLLLANIRSLKTSTELLRDEIEEIDVILHSKD